LKSPPKVLFVSYAFPPLAQVGSLRIARFCKYLPEFGLEPVVLTIQERFMEERDPTMPQPSGIRVERAAEIPTPIPIYRKLFVRETSAAQNGDARPAQRHKAQAAWRRHLLLAVQIPDRRWGWYLPAVRAGKRLLAEEPIGAIFSSAPPWTSHLVAKALMRHRRLPWIMDFRDPWFGNLPSTPAWRNWIDDRLERSCVRLASKVVCNTDLARERMIARYRELPSEHFVTITNGFDDSAKPAKMARSKERLLLLHAGTLYASRRIDTFCAALHQLIHDGRVEPTQIVVTLLGDYDPQLLQAAHPYAAELQERGILRLVPPIGLEEAQRQISEADVLLVFQGAHVSQVPAKFYEYLATGIPVFASAKRGALTDLIEQTQSGRWADCDDVNETAVRLLQALELARSSPRRPSPEIVKRFHVRSLTGQLAQIVNALLQTQRVGT